MFFIGVLLGLASAGFDASRIVAASLLFLIFVITLSTLALSGWLVGIVSVCVALASFHGCYLIARLALFSGTFQNSSGANFKA